MKKLIIRIVIILTMIFFNINIATAAIVKIDNPVKISTFGNDIDKVRYKNYIITSKKILAGGQVAYCLEINKKFPSGQDFYVTHDVDDIIKSIIISGFPNNSATTLNVQSDDEAYLATQIALWCYIEKFDVSQITSDNKKLENAIKNIYNHGVNNKDASLQISEYTFKVYSANSDIQEIITLVKNEEEAPPKIITPEKFGQGTPLEGQSTENLEPKSSKIKETLPQTGGREKDIILLVGIMFIFSGAAIFLRKSTS